PCSPAAQAESSLSRRRCARMRCFVAIDLSPDVRAALEDECERLRAVAPRADVRWVRIAGMHLTLKFLGEVPEEMLARIGTRWPRRPQQAVGSGCFSLAAIRVRRPWPSAFRGERAPQCRNPTLWRLGCCPPEVVQGQSRQGWKDRPLERYSRGHETREAARLVPLRCHYAPKR